MIKAILVLAAVALTMFVIGWLQFSSSETKAVITIDKEQVKEDVSKAAEKVQDLTEELQDQVEQPTTEKPKSPLILP